MQYYITTKVLAVMKVIIIILTMEAWMVVHTKSKIILNQKEIKDLLLLTMSVQV